MRASGNGSENGKASPEKQREVAHMLLQTQKNMLELNNSRVKVQEELASANRRIADLGACVIGRAVPHTAADRVPGWPVRGSAPRPAPRAASALPLSL